MKIAIVKLSALGDIVHAMVALQFIKSYDASIQIDWIVEQGFAQVLQHNPDINAIHTVNLKALKTDKTKLWCELRKIRQIAANHYDLVIDAQGLLKSAITARLLGKKVAGFDKNSIREPIANLFYTLKINSPYHANTIDRNATVLSNPLGFEITSEQILQKKPFLFFQVDDWFLQDYFSTQRKNILLVIGSSWDSKNYPQEKFLELARQLQQNCLLVWGSEAEKNKAEWIAASSGGVNVLPKLTLNELKACIAKADLVIGNDSGPTHLAWGLNKPSITLFGCTPIRQAYQTAINKVLKSPSIVNPYQLNKQDYSIREIEVEQILTLANQLL
jgi:heptosyltransferase-1